MPGKSVWCLMLLCLSAVAMDSKQVQDKSVVIGLVQDVDYILPYEDIIARAWQDIGYEVHFERLPGDRSLRMSNRGILDGELVRTQIIEASHPNLLRVPVLIAKGELLLFCRKTVPCNGGALQNKRNIIGVRSGSLTAIEFLSQHAAQSFLFSSPDIKSMLSNDSRLNYVLTVGVSGYGNLDGITDPVNLASISLVEFDAWHYVHKKHAHLTVSLAESLRRARATYLVPKSRQDLPD